MTRPFQLRAAALVAASALRAADDPVPEDVTFVARHDKTEQKYVVVRPKGFDPKGTNTAIIALHGHGSDRWQFVKQNRGECKGTRAVAAAHGFLLVSPELRVSRVHPAATPRAGARVSWQRADNGYRAVELTHISTIHYHYQYIITHKQ